MGSWKNGLIAYLIDTTAQSALRFLWLQQPTKKEDSAIE